MRIGVRTRNQPETESRRPLTGLAAAVWICAGDSAEASSMRAMNISPLVSLQYQTNDNAAGRKNNCSVCRSTRALPRRPLRKIPVPNNDFPPWTAGEDRTRFVDVARFQALLDFQPGIVFRPLLMTATEKGGNP